MNRTVNLESRIIEHCTKQRSKLNIEAVNERFYNDVGAWKKWLLVDMLYYHRLRMEEREVESDSHRSSL